MFHWATLYTITCSANALYWSPTLVSVPIKFKILFLALESNFCHHKRINHICLLNLATASISPLIEMTVSGESRGGTCIWACVFSVNSWIVVPSCPITRNGINDIWKQTYDMILFPWNGLGTSTVTVTGKESSAVRAIAVANRGEEEWHRLARKNAMKKRLLLDIREKYMVANEYTCLSVYPDKNAAFYKNHGRIDLYQLWKWLSLGRSVGNRWNLRTIFQQELASIESSQLWNDFSIQEEWSQLTKEWTSLGFSLENKNYMFRTGACLWVYLEHGSVEERRQLSRVGVLLQCCSEPKQVLTRRDVLSRLSSCALLLLAVLSFQHWEDIREYYEFLVSYCKEECGRWDWICLTWKSEVEDFLQKYLDETGDIALVALVSLHLGLSTPNTECWLSEYRRILEQLSQWELLAELNIFCQDASLQDTRHRVDAICYFCNKSLLHVPGTNQKANNDITPTSFQFSWRSVHPSPSEKYSMHRVSMACKHIVLMLTYYSSLGELLSLV